MLTSGHSLLKFEILSPLAVGGMGEVYRARDTDLDREVALKVLPMAQNEALRRRFAREAQALAALNHPNVAQIYGYHETDGLSFLSLELVAGEDLGARLARGPLPIDETVAICAQIAEGLEAAHQAGIVHRDLKPANVCITPQGRAKVLDFGLAKLAEQPSFAESIAATPTTEHGALVGTPLYMSPEQTRGLPLDRRTDVWAFGCVLYECLTGKRTFDGLSIADVIAGILEREPDWASLPSQTPASLISLLKACLEKDRERRLEHLGHVRVQLARAKGAGAQKNDGADVSKPSTALTRARLACEAREWQAAFDILAEADQSRQLECEGLELLAECARWIGRNERLFDPLERAHTEFVARADDAGAARTAMALWHANGDAGRQALAKAWSERAGDLIARIPEGPEHARHAWFCSRARGEAGDLDGQEQGALRALELARRFGDRNVEALAMIDLANVATVRGESADALERIRHATSMALGGEIDIFASGMVFCNAIWACRCRGEWQRAQEWTDSATRWLAREQVDYFPGMCRVHRSEVLRIRGELAAAEKECEAATRMVKQALPAYATFPWAELGEVRRRRGNLAGAMSAFQEALSLGWDPQPGLALLFLEQGDTASAHRSMERVFSEPRPTSVCEDRANLLSARTEIALAAGETAIAAAAVGDLEEMAERNGTRWDIAAASHARGMLELAANRPTGAIEHLNRARRVWAELEAPYELATTCALLGMALDADGERARAIMELGAARDAFARIGAERDRARIEAVLADFDGAPNSARPQRPREPAAARMQLEGETWSVLFEGRTVRLHSTRGLEYLAKLLAHPGVECWAIDLAASGYAADRGDAGEVLDAAARDAYRRRASELEEELAETDARTDPDGAERIRGELDAIGRELAAGVGLGGRSRRAGGAVERARQSVTKGIRAAIRKLAAADPALGRYLEATIKTGTACRFEPELREPVEWHIEG